MNKHDPFSLIDAMAFSKMHLNDGLTVGECIAVHQHINSRGEVSENTWVKINKIIDLMEAHKWEKPDLKYDEEYTLWYFDIEKEGWRKVSDIQ